MLRGLAYTYSTSYIRPHSASLPAVTRCIAYSLLHINACLKSQSLNMVLLKPLDTTNTPIHIAIVGGGIGGLALSVGLYHQVHSHLQTTIYEASPSFSEIGALVSLLGRMHSALYRYSRRLSSVPTTTSRRLMAGPKRRRFGSNFGTA